ncbi:MAG: hypothetical protein JW936_09115 [Sedimentisphaerales bacterium]|nr:hypothetical protein [Sedimentisphaerales bacterium]
MKVYKIGSRLEPFVDRFLIESLSDVRLKLHKPNSAGQVLVFDKPWECVGAGYVTVLKDDQRYLMYYRGTYKVSEDDDPAQSTCVAFSDDGIHWEKLDLDFYEVNGCKINNVVLFGLGTVAHNFTPFIDDNPDCTPDEKFKAVGGTTETGLYLLVSHDGLKWRTKYDTPILPPASKDQYFYDSQNVLFYSAVEGCYVCYFRIFEKTGSKGIRSVARRISGDMVNWGDCELMDFGDTPRAQIYTNQTHPYFRADHIYLAICARFMEGRQVLSDAEGESCGVFKYRDIGYWHDCSDCILMTVRPDRSGSIYDRTFMEAFVRPGLDRLNWTSRCNYPAKNVVPTGPSEMSLYIERHNAHSSKYLERMTMRLDGFASINGPYSGGCAVTKAMECPGGRLVLNYATSAAGSVRVGLLDMMGKPIEGFQLEQCETIIGDEIERTVSWNNTNCLDSLKGRALKLCFALADADVFSFQFKVK